MTTPRQSCEELSARQGRGLELALRWLPLLLLVPQKRVGDGVAGEGDCTPKPAKG